jgi:hypothetical protein
MVSSLVVMAAAALFQQPACDASKTRSLPRAKISAVYNGSGSTDDAKNFSCVAP